MPKLIRISGEELIKVLQKEGFVLLRQKSSHVRLSKESKDDTCFVTIPLHSEIDRGTLKNILRSVENYLASGFIKDNFYK
jgi:predicted RNA binding protein YcfA (HicA-like mRNA interferase family)